MWNKDGKKDTQETFSNSDRSYAGIYTATIDFCKKKKNGSTHRLWDLFQT
jgi:monomeric isocitrate dehydrogenase